jgi:ubiquinone/menaquinone biosynthesis C-methylase UbiE
MNAERPIWNQIVFYQAVLDLASGRKWLDLGCGRGTIDAALTPIRKSMNETLYVGTDVDQRSLRDCTERNKVLSDACRLPFPDASFDLISSNMVFEHLDDPLAVLRESHRVLSAGGRLLIHTPSSQHFILVVGRLLSGALPQSVYKKLVSLYEGRKPEDIFPTRYRANTEKAFVDLATKSGLHLVRIRYLETPYVLPRFLGTFEHMARKFLSDRFKSSMLVLMQR